MPDPSPCHELELEDPGTGRVFTVRWPAWSAYPIVGSEDRLMEILDLQVPVGTSRLAAYVEKMAVENDVDHETAKRLLSKVGDELSAWMAGVPDEMARSFRAFVWAIS